MNELFIDRPEQLAEFCAAIADVRVLALDTEFYREKTYYAQLCLLQVAAHDVIACIDPLALPDLQPLLAIIYDPSKTKLLHAARQDMEIFYDLCQALPAPVFDTQIAATLLGYGDQIGYANLVKTMFGVRLDKAHTRTDWSQRPLDTEQIHYAMDDVRYLIPMYERQSELLAQKGRLRWLDQDFASLSDVSLYAPAEEQLWTRVRGAKFLKGVQLAALQRLTIWRETLAKQLNRPRRWILSDELLLEICRRMPTSAESLEKVRGCGSIAKRYAQDITTHIQSVKTLPAELWPRVDLVEPLSIEQEALADVLMGIVRVSAVTNEVSPVVLAKRKEIEKLVQGDAHSPLNYGWRYELIGKELQTFLQGEKCLCMRDSRLNVTDLSD